jgi:hypothetical protein
MSIHRAAPLGALVLLSSVASAALPVEDLVEVTSDTVYRWNPNASTNVFVKNVAPQTFGDMTQLQDGRIVAYRTSSQGATPALFEINRETGGVSLVIQSESAARSVVALARMRNGHLFASDNTLHYISIDPETLAYTQLSLSGPNFFALGSSGGMATSRTGDIYAWCSGSSSSTGITSALFLIDPIAGTADRIGSGYDHLPASQSFQAMSFTPDGRLFGFTDVNGGINGGPFQPRGIYELDLQTGFPGLLAQRTELGGVRGVVFLPEPGATVLLTIAVAPLLSRPRRRKHAK